MPVTERKKKKPTARKKARPNGSKEKPQSKKAVIDKDEIVQKVAVEYNLLLSKISSTKSSLHELKRSAAALEESYLWFRCAVEKAELDE